MRARWEWIIPVLTGLLLLWNCYEVSQARYFWFDEVLTYYPAAMPTYAEMYAFITDKINCGHYLYFMAVWFYSQLAGASELSLRLFSSVGVIAGLFLLWSTLRRAHGFWPASLSTTFVFLFSRTVVAQNAEARFYGMLIAFSSALIYLTNSYNQDSKLRWRQLAALFVVNGALPLVHPFGFVYSLLVLAVVFGCDALKKRLRPAYYLSSLGGWLLFLPFLPAFLRQRELSKPHYWIGEPDLNTLLMHYLQSKIYLAPPAVALFACAALLLKKVRAGTLNLKNRWELSLLGAAAYSLPLAVWLASKIALPLFISRYLLLSDLGMAILLSTLLYHALDGIDFGPKSKFLLWGMQFALLAFMVLRCLQVPPRGLVPGHEIEEFVTDSVVVTGDPLWFLPVAFYGSPEVKAKTYLALDWEWAVESPILNETQDYQAMMALKSHLPELKIIEAEEFLKTRDDFILFDRRTLKPQLLKREYTLKEVEHRIWRVHRTK